MLPPISDEITQLVRSLTEGRSLLERVRREDHRIATLAQIAASGEVRVVPELLLLLPFDDALAPHLARTITDLARKVTPVQLSSLDERMRQRSDSYQWFGGGWRTLAPEAVPRLAETIERDPVVIGLLASHANGYVRAAAIEELADSTGGEEIAFLSIRANDWVEPVASRASELLLNRLRPDNRHAVLNALPFIARVLRQRRRDHREIEKALRAVLLSDGGREALARGMSLDTRTRRVMYALMTSGTTPQRRLIIEALTDPDGLIRARAARFVAADADFEDRAEMLERLLHDRVPGIRRLGLSAISEQLPERIAGLFPGVLFDRAASVRSLARFVVSTHRLPIVPRDLYVEGLSSNHPRQLSAAIEGVGETGAPADADLVAPFMSSRSTRIRRSVLIALARLDVERAIASAIAALADEASSVRSAANDILSTNANTVNFEIVGGRMRSLSDPRFRRDALRVCMHAPKWEAAAFLLEALMDPDDAVRTFASRLMDQWMESFNRRQTQPTTTQLQRIRTLLDSVAPRLSDQTAKKLRFSIKPL